MVGPSPQNSQPQEGQGYPTAFGPPPPVQHPPMGGGYPYASPPPPPPPLYAQPIGGRGPSNTNKTIISIGNLSLFAIAASLIFFGAFTFLGGFLLGMWLETPAAPAYVFAQENAPVVADASPRRGGRQGGSGTEMSQALEKSAHTVTEDFTASHVPYFLAPLVTATQHAAERQVAHKMQKSAERPQRVAEPPVHAPSSPQAQPLISPRTPESRGFLPTSQGGEAPALPPPPVSQEGPYSVQLGVYATRENADALREKLQALSYTTSVTEGKAADGSTLYYVHSGRYDDFSTASKVAARFTSQNIPGAIVVKISKSGQDAS